MTQPVNDPKLNPKSPATQSPIPGAPKPEVGPLQPSEWSPKRTHPDEVTPTRSYPEEPAPKRESPDVGEPRPDVIRG